MNIKNNFKITEILIICIVVICCSGFSALQMFRMPLFGFISILLLFISMKHGKITIVFSYLGMFISIFTGYILLSSIVSYDVIETLKYSYIYIAVTLMVIIPLKREFYIKVINIMFNCQKFIAITIILNAIIPNLFSQYLIFLIDEGINARSRLVGEISSGIYSGIMGEKGEATYIMVVSIIFLLAKSVADKKITKSNKIWLFIFVCAMMLPAKRMLFAIGILICMLYLIFWTKGSKRIIALSGFGLLACISFLIASFIPALSTLMERFSDYSGDVTANGRTYLWEHSISMFNEKPFLGYGYGSFNAYASDAGVLLTANGIWTSQAHNIYIQLLGEVGIVGFLLFCIIAIYGIYMFVKLYKKRNFIEQEDIIILFTGGNLQIMTLIYGLSGNCIYYANQIMVYFLGIAMVLFLQKKYKYLY